MNIAGNLHELIHNVALWATLFAWMAAQLIKLAIHIVRTRSFDFGFLLRLGGMPSSHPAASTAGAVCIGCAAGFDSPTFAVAAGLVSLIVIDAQSVRYAAGEQARLLNQMAADFYRDHKISPKKLVEFLGHTRLEVFAGFLLGLAIAIATQLYLAPFIRAL